MALNPGSRAKNLHWAPIVISSFFIALTALLAGFVVVAERGLPSFLGDWFFSENARARQVSSFLLILRSQSSTLIASTSLV